MKKSLVALALLGAVAGTAYAQSNVTIYGVMDTGYVKKTGHDLDIDENVESRIGFRGTEDLGGGMKAIFELEKRFDVGSGERKGVDWEGASNVGLKSDTWGTVRLGRMEGIATENIRKFDPFYQYGVGAMLESPGRGEHVSHLLRYDSPEWAGFSFNAAYELGRNMNSRSREVDGRYVRHVKWDEAGLSNGSDNDGYQLGLNYRNGGFAATANYQMLADTNRSHLWNVGVSYAWDTVKVEALYQQTLERGMGWVLGDYDPTLPFAKKYYDQGSLEDDFVKTSSFKIRQALLGVEWKVGPGRLNASAQWYSVDDPHFDLDPESGNTTKLDDDAWKVAVGYTYNLSKRTSLYGIVAYTDWGNPGVAYLASETDQDSMTAVQLGITHKF